MKKTLLCLTIALFACIAITSALFAANAPTKQLSVSATVDSAVPEMDITILKITDGDPDSNPWTNYTDVTGSMALTFGNLVHTYTDPVTGLPKESGVWYSKTAYCVVVYTQGFGKKYEVKSSCSGIGTIPNDATHNYFGLTPVYTTADYFLLPDGTKQYNQVLSATGTLGATGNAIGSIAKVVFTSLSPSSNVVLQAWYSIPTKKLDGTVPYTGWTGIPLTQAAGAYTGTVTLSIVAA